MKNFFYALLIFSLAISCNPAPKSGLNLGGQIKGQPAGSKIILEEITFSNRTSIDTAELDAQGDFSIQTNIKNLGLYQLVVNGKNGLFLVLDEKPAKVQLTADSVSIANYNYKIIGSNASEQLRSFVFQMKDYGEKFGKTMREYDTVASDSAADSVKNIYAAKVAMADSSFRIFINGYVDTVKNPIIAMFAATNLDMKTDWPTVQKLTEKIKREYASLPFSQAFISVIDEQEKNKSQDYYTQMFETGNVVPDIELPDVKGNLIKLSSLHGKIVLLDFWASWCGPCRAENPNVVAAYKKYSGKGFTVFSVSLDNEKSKWINAINKDGLVWSNHVSELKGWNSEICQVYGLHAIPQNYLLDAEGKVIAYNLRGDALNAQLSNLLK